MIVKRLHFYMLLLGSVLFAQENTALIGSLPTAVHETSGLLFFNDHLITHNDSGNSPQLFEIDTLSLEIKRMVTVVGANNMDWEDLAQDDDYIYIGDFGNFEGGRQDLVIYRVSKPDYRSSDMVVAERIDFSYPDQPNGTNSSGGDWDAEALFVLGNNLIILTKQWQTMETVAYSVPKVPGNQVAVNLGSYPVGGLVTGASYHEASKNLVLLGYSQQLSPFIFQFNDITATDIFANPEEKRNLNILIAQMEGITHVSENTLFASAELFENDSPRITLPPQLFSITAPSKPTEEENPEGDIEGELVLYRNEGSKILQYELNTSETLFGRAVFDTAGKRIRFTHANAIEEHSIDLSTLAPSIYYLTFYLRSGIVSKPFLLN
ncbi:hypothetical protein [Spongiimicrobium sp. 3-5]|uniref:hypothetical protein n=1 Tax=Spongiimicrobium sp. 3-5 TaxID=3332596 RepID=UPI00398049EA